jgi:hyaluronate lyase
MTLLYNADLGQYNDGYWATADMYHVPGTTASTNERLPCSGSRKLSPGGRTYGANTGSHASIGMRYISWKETTKATKSWFFLDNEIVCLGAGITSMGPTHTTIDQRRFSTQQDISLDNMNMTHESTFTKTLESKSVRTVRLESNVDEASDIAYYIYETNSPVMINKVDRIGSWIDVNNGHILQDNTPFQQKYVSIVIDHGDSPVNASYVYSIRPKPELISSTDASFRVLINAENVQAVQSSDERVMGAIFYTYGQVDGMLAANTSCAITITQPTVNATSATVAIELAEPDSPAEVTLMQFAKYRLGSGIKGAQVTSMDNGLRVEISNPFVTFDLFRD